MTKKKKNVFEPDPEQWVVIELVRFATGGATSEHNGFRFQMKQYDFWKHSFEAKHGCHVDLTFTEVK